MSYNYRCNLLLSGIYAGQFLFQSAQMVATNAYWMNKMSVKVIVGAQGSFDLTPMHADHHSGVYMAHLCAQGLAVLTPVHVR